MTTLPSAQQHPATSVGGPPSILHVVAGSDFGGGSRVVDALATAANEGGFEVAVLTSDPRLQRCLRMHGVVVVDDIVVPRRLQPVADLVALIRLTRHLRQHRYDIVHTHTSKGGLIGRLAASLARVPVVVHTAHGFGFHEQSGTWGRRMQILTERVLGTMTTVLVTVSDHHRRLGAEVSLAPARKLVAVPNGIADPWASRPTATPTSCRGVITLVSHGRLAPQKGLTYLLQAVSRLPDDLRFGCRLQIVGEGELERALRTEAATLRIHGQVEFLGFRDDVHDLVAHADVVVLPSLWEGLSISLLEAMGLGKAVITTAIPSNLEVVGGSACAVLVPPMDPAALAAAIATLLRSSEERARLGASARSRYVETYTAGRMCERYLEIYRTAVAT